MRPHITTLPSVRTGARPWLYGEAEPNSVVTVTLDITKFGTVSSAFPNGYIPAGVALGLITADGTYGIYNGGAVAEVQTVTIDGTGGTFTLSYEGNSTSALAFDATGAQVQAALEALPGISPGDVTVSDPVLKVYTVTFGGQFTGKNVATLGQADSLTGGAGTVTVATVTQGEAGAATDGRQTGRGLLLNDVTWRDSSGAALAAGFEVTGMLINGVIREAKLPTNHGVDAAFKVDQPHLQWI